MKVMYVNSAVQNIKPMKLAKTICKTKRLPSDVSRQSANTVLSKKSGKLTLSTFLSIAGIASAYALMVDSIDNDSLIETAAAFGTGVVSTITGIVSALKRKTVLDARDIINGGKSFND